MPLLKELKNKAVLNLKPYCMHCYVALILINAFKYMYLLPVFKQEAAKEAGQIFVFVIVV